MDECNQGIFFKIRVVFVQFCIEGQGDLPSSPSSYTPATGSWELEKFSTHESRKQLSDMQD